MSLSNEPILEIEGGTPLKGVAKIEGAKNAALPALVAACFSSEEVVLQNMPVFLNDIKIMIELLREQGAIITVNYDLKTITCNGENITGGKLNVEKANKIRHSLLLLGLFAYYEKDGILPMPGGCDLGNRKHDMHIEALQKTGNQVKENEGLFIYPLKLDQLDNKMEITIDFYYPTFGGTFNAIFSALRLENKITYIQNAAKNPEVQDVINLLVKMGAGIKWLKHDTLMIRGNKVLNGACHKIVPDRIIAATLIAATGITKGNVLIKDIHESLLSSEIETWKKTGIEINQVNNDLQIIGSDNLIAQDITTSAYPGFHTDIQPLHVALMIFSKGRSQVKETILNGRFRYCNELKKTGADINVIDGNFKCVNGADGQIAIINGDVPLTSASMKATDIRGAASVAITALGIMGTSYITNLYQLERGYASFVELFNSLGASVIRKKQDIM